MATWKHESSERIDRAIEALSRALLVRGQYDVTTWGPERTRAYREAHETVRRRVPPEEWARYRDEVANRKRKVMNRRRNIASRYGLTDEEAWAVESEDNAARMFGVLPGGAAPRDYSPQSAR